MSLDSAIAQESDREQEVSDRDTQGDKPAQARTCAPHMLLVILLVPSCLSQAALTQESIREEQVENRDIPSQGRGPDCTWYTCP